MLKIGITGGIGSGKSTACKIFQSLDIPIYDTDSRAKIVTNSNIEIRKEIIENFGEEAYSDNIMNRRFVGDIVFTDLKKMEILNSIIHPRVAQDFKEWVDEQSSPYILKEAAIMFEANAHKDLDKIITVTAPLNLRLERIRLRDPQRNDEEIMNIIKNQMSEEEKIKLSDYVISNETKEELYIQVLNLDKLFRNSFAKIY